MSVEDKILKVKTLLKERGFSQKYLADNLSISRSTLHRRLKGPMSNRGIQEKTLDRAIKFLSGEKEISYSNQKMEMITLLKESLKRERELTDRCLELLEGVLKGEK